VSRYTGLTGDLGLAGIYPNASFAADLLEGREPLLGLFVAGPDANATTAASGAFYEAGAGELTIGCVLGGKR
jgi:hypothetical protein